METPPTPVDLAQKIRLFDMLLLGPAMVLAGTRLGQQGGNNSLLGAFIAAAGVGTFLYNSRNFAIIEQGKRPAIGVLWVPLGG